MLNRRYFLRGSTLAMMGVGAAPQWLARAATGARKKVLVAIFQRGAMDGLSAVVPYGEKEYYALRPGLAVAAKDCVDLDGFFGFHPSLAPLAEAFRAKQLAVIEAVGSPDPTRSHFDAQDYMESGTPGRKATADGWLNRALTPASQLSPVRAVSLGPNLPRALRGKNAAVAVNSLREFQVKDSLGASAFESLYAHAGDSELRSTGKETFEAIRMVQSVQRQPYTPSGGAVYPNGRLGQSLLQIARLIKAGVGLEVAFADVGGWDTHVNQANTLTNLFGEFAKSVEAFRRDMGDGMADVLLLTMSEFGRTARENGNRGTDHGHANIMLALGAGVRGGKVHGKWPGLAREQLYEGRDLALTTDFRDVLGEAVSVHLGNRNPDAVFPGYTPRPLGVLERG
ncbi:MAG: DUF1501 domain-containing protein [Bryobacterales bacterium]|nr:DUF1501 domain-containing protein [Bryobacterales bacterium]